MLLPSDRPPELDDLERDSAPVPLPWIGSATNVLGCFGTNIVCHWNGGDQIIVRELRGAEFIQRGAIALDSRTRPTGVAYHPARQLLAWTEASTPASICLASLDAPVRRIELKSDVPGLVPFGLGADGLFLVGWSKEFALGKRNTLRVWNVESREIIASVGGLIRDAAFAAGGQVLVVTLEQGNDHAIEFHDLANPDRAPRRVPGKLFSYVLAASPNGEPVASPTMGGQVRLFDPAKGELLETLHGHLNGAHSVAFSPDGRRLISTSGGREAVKLWDVGTRQELLTLGGTGSAFGEARWSGDGNVILAGPPWQAWRAPSWEEITAAEARQRAGAEQP